MRSLNALVWRNLRQAGVRAVLNALAVALGVAMVVATSVVSSSVRNAWTGSGNAMAWIGDLIDVMTSSVGGIILAAAGFVVFNALAMAVTQRRRQVGLLRSLGMTYRQVIQLVLAEALVTGGAGTLLGLAGGPLLGQGLLLIVRQMGLEIGASQVSLTSVVLAVVMGLVVSLLSAWLPARRAARTSPLAALHEPSPASQAGRGRVSRWIGLGLVAGLLLYLAIAPPGEWTGKTPPWEWIMPFLLWAVWLAAFGCLAPALIAGTIRIVRGLLCRLGGAVGRLLVDNLERASHRVTLTVLAFAVGLAMTVGVGGVLAFNNEVLLGHFVD